MSTVGRPREVTDWQIARIIAWNDAMVAIEAQLAQLPTLNQLCEELKVSRGTVYYVIKKGGALKQPTPELRPEELRKRRQRLKQVRGSWRRARRDRP